MGWVVRTRREGVERASDEAAAAWRAAAAAKKRGDLAEMERLNEIACAADGMATAFADGRNDDVVRDRQGGRR